MSWRRKGGIGAGASVAIAGAAALIAAAAPAEGPDARRPPRPFEHRRHESVSCRSCHGVGEGHRTFLVRTPRDCASCHHDARRAEACADCHDAERLPPPAPVAAAMTLGVWERGRTRAVTFRHDAHLRPGKAVACRDCHRAPVTLAPERACASCHAEHHGPEATCASCHQEARAGAHTADVHLSCAGAGCHASDVAPAPAQSRGVCLACHAKQKEHEPGGACATCHRVPGAAAR